uniref:Uncharacterized protein n=1 Tax=Oryza glumipatula TaxID=40148 RepID=A0A0E0ASK9_9ORYZ
MTLFDSRLATLYADIGLADEVYLAKDYIHVIAWVSTSLISFARNSIGKPRQSGPPTRRQDSIPCLVDLLRRRAAGSCIDALRPRSLPRSSPHCRINVDVARLASLLSGTSYLRQRVAVSSIKALLSPLLEAPPPFLLDNAVRVDAADIKDFRIHYYNRKGIHAQPMPTFGIFSLYSVGVGAPGEAME